MSEMTMHEIAYRGLKLKQGDRVRIMFRVDSNTGGWENTWSEGMRWTVGCVGRVAFVTESDREYNQQGVRVAFTREEGYSTYQAYSFPAFCLEKLSSDLPPYPKTFKSLPIQVMPSNNVDAPSKIRMGGHELYISRMRLFRDAVLKLDATVPQHLRDFVYMQLKPDTYVTLPEMVQFMAEMYAVTEYLEKNDEELAADLKKRIR